MPSQNPEIRRQNASRYNKRHFASPNPSGFNPEKPAPFVPRVTRHVFCNHWHYRDGRLSQCGAPTKNGKHACEDCRKLEMQSCGAVRKDNMFSRATSRTVRT